MLRLERTMDDTLGSVFESEVGAECGIASSSCMFLHIMLRGEHVIGVSILATKHLLLFAPLPPFALGSDVHCYTLL